MFLSRIDLTAADRADIFFANRYVTRPHFYRFAKNNSDARAYKEELNALLAGPFNQDTVRRGR